MKKVMLFGILMLAILLFQINVAPANKSEASIEGPTDAARGSEVTLRNPRIPCKLWVRDDFQPVMRQHPGIVTDETCREDSREALV